MLLWESSNMEVGKNHKNISEKVMRIARLQMQMPFNLMKRGKFKCLR